MQLTILKWHLICILRKNRILYAMFFGIFVSVMYFLIVLLMFLSCKNETICLHPCLNSGEAGVLSMETEKTMYW